MCCIPVRCLDNRLEPLILLLNGLGIVRVQGAAAVECPDFTPGAVPGPSHWHTYVFTHTRTHVHTREPAHAYRDMTLFGSRQ